MTDEPMTADEIALRDALAEIDRLRVERSNAIEKTEAVCWAFVNAIDNAFEEIGVDVCRCSLASLALAEVEDITADVIAAAVNDGKRCKADVERDNHPCYCMRYPIRVGGE